MNRIQTLFIPLMSISALILCGSMIAEAQNTIEVNCAADQNMTDALAIVNPGDTISVLGSCNEQIILSEDYITINGNGTAILDGSGREGPVVLAERVRGVTIKNLTIKNGSSGIVASKGASIELEGVVAENNASNGITISENSTVTMTDCQTRNNGGSGVSLILNSSVMFNGNINSNNNTTGIEATINSSIYLQDAMAEIIENENGIGLIDSALLSDGSSVNTKTSSNLGISLLFNSTLITNNSNMNIIQSGGFGLSILFNSAAIIDDSSILAEENSLGIIISDNSNSNINRSIVDTRLNQTHGLIVGNNSVLQIQDNSVVTSENNTSIGIGLALFSALYCARSTTVTSRGNGADFVNENSFVACN